MAFFGLDSIIFVRARTRPPPSGSSNVTPEPLRQSCGKTIDLTSPRGGEGRVDRGVQGFTPGANRARAPARSAEEGRAPAR